MACLACGRSLEGRDRRAKYCDTNCRVKGARRRKRTGEPIAPAGVRVEKQIERAGGVYPATIEVLTRAERHATPHGAMALALAARIDAALDSGSALAAAVKQLDAALAEAMKGAVPATASRTDDLRVRRDAKRRSA